MLTRSEIQRLRALRERKRREAEGLFVAEGGKIVNDLLGAGSLLCEIYATAEWREPPAHRFPASLRLTRVTPVEMSRISHFPGPSPVLAVGRIPRTPLAAGALDRGLTLALDDLQDAGNVGTLLRVADWFAFDRVLLSPRCADLFNQKVINASMGSFARVATHRIDLAEALSAVAPGTPVLGCDLDGENALALMPTRNAVVLVGSEGNGLSPAVSALVTRRITIPRFGKAESLNAAVAAGIVCAQLARHRPADLNAATAANPAI